jgi:hypothetical protein
VSGRRVGLVAEDLIWATRLGRAIEDGGGIAVPIRRSPSLARSVADLDALVVDLGGRDGAPLAAIEAAHEVGTPTLAVGPHDDVALRDSARAAGAARVLAYRAVHASGAATVGAWLREIDEHARKAGPEPAGPPVGHPEEVVP